jgi:hypothetical protein
VTAFAARNEGYGGTLPTLLTLGGVWNADVVPGNRGDLLPLIFAFVMLLISVAGVVLWWRQDRVAGALVVAAVIAVMVGMAGVVAPGAFADVVANVPGAGLFRDGQRYLAPLVLLECIGFGAAVHVLLQHVPLHRVVGATAVLLPIAALPSLIGGPGLKVSQYPADWERAQQVLAGPFIPWPFESYRAPVWNGRRPVLDPMPRYFDQPAVVPDELIVAGHRLAGEDPRAAAVATAVRTAMRSGTDPTPVLLQQGVGWLVVDREAGGPSPRDSIAGLTEAYSGSTVSVYQLPGSPVPQRNQPWRTGVVLAAWMVAGATLVAGLAGLVMRRSRVWRSR